MESLHGRQRRSPRWSATAHELLFTAKGKIMFAPYTVVGDAFRAETRQISSPTSIVRFGPGQVAWDPHPDGTRIATAAAEEQANVVQDKVVFVFNFADYLRTIAPGIN